MSLTERLAALLPARSTLHILLAPQSLLAVARHGGRAVDGGTLHIAFSNPGGLWDAPLAALRTLLAQPVQARAEGNRSNRSNGSHARRSRTEGCALHALLAARPALHVSLSGRWCQMLMAPWSDALLSEPGAAHFLETQFAAVYGEDARGWTVASDDAPYGQPRLACAIPTGLLDALRAIAAEHGMRCAAIEPLASTVAASLAAGKPEAFVIAEPGRITMAALAHGRIAAIQLQPCSAAWHGELVQAWQRWSLRVPELAAIAGVAVVDLSGAAAGLAAGRLPSHFRLAVSPFEGAASEKPGVAREAA